MLLQGINVINVTRWDGIISFMTGVPHWVKRGVVMSNDRKEMKNPKYEVPLWHKTNLSIEEAVAYPRTQGHFYNPQYLHGCHKRAEA